MPIVNRDVTANTVPSPPDGNTTLFAEGGIFKAKAPDGTVTPFLGTPGATGTAGTGPQWFLTAAGTLMNTVVSGTTDNGIAVLGGAIYPRFYNAIGVFNTTAPNTSINPSAKELAIAINAVAGTIQIVASASNSVTMVPTVDNQGSGNTTFHLNGVAMIWYGDLGNTIQALNSSSATTGVFAKMNPTADGIILTSDGSDIKFSNFNAGTIITSVDFGGTTMNATTTAAVKIGSLILASSKGPFIVKHVNPDIFSGTTDGDGVSTQIGPATPFTLV